MYQLRKRRQFFQPHVVHGVLIDTVKLEVRLLIDKIEKIREMLINIKNRKTVKLNELQSLLG